MNWQRPCFGFEEVECDDDCTKKKPGAPSPPSSRGKPVSLTTGGAFFTHTDAVVGDLVFSRTFHSRRMNWGIGYLPYGAFGPGWNSSFEVRLDLVRSYYAAARNADGNPQYYFDKNGSGVMKSVLPRSSESWVTSTTCPDGLPAGFCYNRVFRAGGFETYWAYASFARGYLMSTTDPSGVVTTYAYDAQSRLSSVSRFGRSIVLVYSGISTQPWQLRDGTGLVLATYGYTGGFLSSVTYADGGGYQYIPSSSSWPPRVAAVLDHAGKKIEAHEYDSSGRALTSESGDRVEKLTFSYGTAELTVRCRPATGHGKSPPCGRTR